MFKILVGQKVKHAFAALLGYNYHLFYCLQRQLPCRIAAADAIVSFLRHCRRSHQREEIRRRIKEGEITTTKKT